jgi:hypothetical protein
MCSVGTLFLEEPDHPGLRTPQPSRVTYSPWMKRCRASGSSKSSPLMGFAWRDGSRANATPLRWWAFRRRERRMPGSEPPELCIQRGPNRGSPRRAAQRALSERWHLSSFEHPWVRFLTCSYPHRLRCPKFEPVRIARTARRNTCGGPVMRFLWTSSRHPNGSKDRNKALSGSHPSKTTLSLCRCLQLGVRTAWAPMPPRGSSH